MRLEKLKKAARLSITFLTYLVLVLCCVFIVRATFLDIFKIPSDSMRDKLKTGDYIVINKTIYSGVLAMVLQKAGCKARINRDDIVVFTIGYGTDYFIKRCVAGPGDKIVICHGELKVNQKRFPEALDIRKTYKLWYNNYQRLEEALDNEKIPLYQLGFKRHHKYLSIVLSISQKNGISKIPFLDSITRDTQNETSALQLDNIDAYNQSERIVPFKGMKIKLNDSTWKLYGPTILNSEGTDIVVRGVRIYKNYKLLTDYTFSADYYFLMGDNRDFSKDSRYFGFINENWINGKYLFKF